MVVVNTQTGASPRWNRNRCSSASVRPPKIRATGTPRASSASAIGRPRSTPSPLLRDHHLIAPFHVRRGEIDGVRDPDHSGLLPEPEHRSETPCGYPIRYATPISRRNSPHSGRTAVAVLSVGVSSTPSPSIGAGPHGELRCSIRGGSCAVSQPRTTATAGLQRHPSRASGDHCQEPNLRGQREPGAGEPRAEVVPLRRSSPWICANSDDRYRHSPGWCPGVAVTAMRNGALSGGASIFVMRRM